MGPMRILVTDGDNRAALAIVRALGRAGFEMVVGERHTPSLAQTSRYCRDGLVYPDPATEGQAWVETLLRAIEQHHIDVLLPVSDITTALVVERRAEFERRCIVPLASAAAIDRASDKVDVLTTAMRLGIAVPQTRFLETAAAVRAHARDLAFPVVVKARRSRIRVGTGWAAFSVGYAADAIALERMVAEYPPEAFPLILQERIGGPGIGVFACYDEGRAVAWFSHRRLREKPPSGGVSVLSESIPMCPVAHQSAQLLLQELGWRGVAMVEFKVDDRDNVPKLMEINGRFWGSLQLAVDAGVDFPAILLSTFRGAPPQRMPEYRVGVKNRWLWGDFDALLLRLLGRADAGEDAGAKLRAVASFMRLWQKDLHYENPKLSDLRPWFYETRRWVRGGRAA
jgi:predicted ATP-grasp superfamily ATP-dependent carboligase